MLTDADIDALRSGRHGDPFALLGPHVGADGKRWIRAFLPGAREVRAFTPGGAALGRFECRHDDGIFERQVARAGPYRLKVTWVDGRTVTACSPLCPIITRSP